MNLKFVVLVEIKLICILSFDNLEKISKEKDVIIYCRTGTRSSNIIKMLEDTYSYKNLYNLNGGIMRWREDVDNSIKEY